MFAEEIEKFSESASTGSPPQEYFPIPQDLSSKQILANYKADIPPVFQANVRQNVISSIPYEGEITRIKKLTRKPEGAVPRNGLHAWKELSPQDKLPDLREQSQGDIYYTRGQLCKSLNKTKPEFDLSDPNNQRKVLELKEYSALHDPHCKTYFNKPSVLKHLKKQKLINNRKEVLCSVHEFNHYRSYLGELFCDQVRRRIGDNEAMRDLERGVSMAICNQKKRRETMKTNTYQARHRQIHSAYVEATKQRSINKVERWKQKLSEIENQNAQISRARAGMYTLRHWNAFRARQRANKVDELKKKNTLIQIAYTETKNDYTTKYDKFVRQALFERLKADQAAIMIARDDQLDDMQELVDETLKRSRNSWIRNYNTFIVKCRKDPLGKYNERQNTIARRRYLMRKYFDLWIDFLLRTRELKSSDLHHSFFQVDRKLKPFVEKMKTLSSSDLETDDELTCAAGDNVCIKRKHKIRRKLNNLVRINVYPDKPDNQLKKVRSVGTKIFPSRDNIHSSKVSKTSSKKQQHQKESQEEDIGETDEFIDRMVARYKLQHERLLEKLKPGSVPKDDNLSKVPLHLQSVRTLSERQEGHKEAIKVLSDINQVMNPEDKQMQKMGWKAMKL